MANNCTWDPSKHGGKPCPIHSGGMWDENILTKKDKIEKLKAQGYNEEEIEEELKSVGFDDDYDSDFEEDWTDEKIDELIGDSEYVYGNLESKDQLVESLMGRNQVPEDVARDYVERHWEEYKKFYNEDNEFDDDYERSYGPAPDKEEEPEKYKEYMESYNKWLKGDNFNKDNENESQPSQENNEKQSLKPTEGILNHDNKYKYSLLGRMKADADYYLNAKADKYLWSGNPEQHILDMRTLYNSFDENEKPEWLDEEKINQYEKEFKKIKSEKSKQESKGELPF